MSNHVVLGCRLQTNSYCTEVYSDILNHSRLCFVPKTQFSLCVSLDILGRIPLADPGPLSISCKKSKLQRCNPPPACSRFPFLSVTTTMICPDCTAGAQQLQLAPKSYLHAVSGDPNTTINPNRNRYSACKIFIVAECHEPNEGCLYNHI